MTKKLLMILIITLAANTSFAGKTKDECSDYWKSNNTAYQEMKKNYHLLEEWLEINRTKGRYADGFKLYNNIGTVKGNVTKARNYCYDHGIKKSKGKYAGTIADINLMNVLVCQFFAVVETEQSRSKSWW